MNNEYYEDDEYYSGEDEQEEESHEEYKEKGNDNYRKKQYRSAIANYTLAIDHVLGLLEDEDGENKELKEFLVSYYGNRAAAFMMILCYKEALSDIESALKIDNSFVKGYIRKGKALLCLGKFDESLAAFNSVQRFDPNNAQIIKEKNGVESIQHKVKSVQVALKLLYDAAKLSMAKKRSTTRKMMIEVNEINIACPAWDGGLLLKAECLLYMSRYHVSPGKVDEAYSLTASLLRKKFAIEEQAESKILLLRAKCLFEMGQVDDAVKHLRQILQGDPDNKEAIKEMKILRNLSRKKTEGDTAYKSRKFDDAISIYTSIIDSLKEAYDECAGRVFCAKVYFNRGACNANLRKHQECVHDCTSAIELDDEYLKAYVRRANSNLVIGGEKECQAAINDFEKAQSLASEDEYETYEEKIDEAKVALKRSKRKDLYKLLGVTKDATDSEIKKAYRKLALKLHPDRHANSSEEEKSQAEMKFREVNLAYEILSDPEKKKRYDSGVDENEIDDPHARPGGGHGGFGGGHGGIDPDLLFHMFMQQQMGGMGGGGGGGGGRRRARGPSGFHFH